MESARCISELPCPDATLAIALIGIATVVVVVGVAALLVRGLDRLHAFHRRSNDDDS